MNDPRHPVQPAPAVLPRPGGPAAPAMPAAAPVARPLTAPGQLPHPQHAPQHAPQHVAQPAQRIPMAQPVGAPQQQQRVAMPAGMPAARPVQAPVAPAAPAKPQAAADDAISLVEDADADEGAEVELLSESSAPSKIKFGADIGIKKHAWKRALKQGGMGASRVRTFHGKLSDQGLEYIDEAINVWLDEHPEIDVKFVTTNVGMFDGKFKDLALVVNVWY